MSVAAAEAKAKARLEYQLYRKLTYIYYMAEEQVKSIKKFAGELADERKRGWDMHHCSPISKNPSLP